MYWRCLYKVDQIDHFRVDELVDPIKQHPPIISDSTSQIADTNDNVLTTEKNPHRIWCKFLRSMNFNGIVDIMKGQGLDGFFEMKIKFG